MIKLKPCPFCGGEPAVRYESFRPFYYNWVVRCTNCGARTENHFEAVNKAVKAWNTRHEPPTPGGAIVPAGNERLRG